MKPKKVTLGKWQIKCLTKIFKEEICCELQLLAALHGTASNWARRYKQRLNSAIRLHNQNLANNSPIPKNLKIEKGPCGFKLVFRGNDDNI